MESLGLGKWKGMTGGPGEVLPSAVLITIHCYYKIRHHREIL